MTLKRAQTTEDAMRTARNLMWFDLGVAIALMVLL
jgi:hypothetical protein